MTPSSLISLLIGKVVRIKASRDGSLHVRDDDYTNIAHTH